MARARTIAKYDPRVRRGKVFAKATLSPWGLVAGGALAVLGVALGVGIPWIIGAGVVAWGTSAGLHLRDPSLLRQLIAPDFDRDLTVLDKEHLSYMEAGLEARERFLEASRDMPEGLEFSGMTTRITEVLRQLYDSIVWAQRAGRFLHSVNEMQVAERLRTQPNSSPLAGELREQLEEVRNVRRRRDETLARVGTTITGIDTLAVKVASLALGTAGQVPGQEAPSEEVRDLRAELDAYADGLAEIEAGLRDVLPPSSA